MIGMRVYSGRNVDLSGFDLMALTNPVQIVGAVWNGIVESYSFVMTVVPNTFQKVTQQTVVREWAYLIRQVV